MTLSYKTLPLEQVGLDLTKEVSTSGTIHSFIPSRNSILLAPEDGAQGLVIDIENLTSLLGTVRGQSNDLSAQFQTQVGPNAQRTLHLPYSGDWSFSVSCPFKLSKVQALNFFPDTNYDQLGITSPVIKCVGQNLKKEPSGNYESIGLSNVQLPLGYTKDDLVVIDSHGTDIVWKLGDIRFRHTGVFLHYVPFNTLPQILAVGSQNAYKFSVDMFMKKKFNPAYVAPEAALWSFENELG